MGLVLDSNLAIATSAATTAAPRIGASSLFRDSSATVTASAETSGGEHENAWKEGLTTDFWRPGSSGDHWLRVSLGSSAKADYLAIAAHDLHQTGGTVKAQYSTDGGSTWADAHTAVTVGDSQPVMILFMEVEAADWRLHVSSTSPVSIGAVHIGAVTKMRVGIPPPWAPPYLARDNEFLGGPTEGGQFAGLTILPRGARLSLDLQTVPLSWARGTWEPVVRLIEQYPFFFAARDVAASGVRESEVFYGWVTGQPETRYETPMHGTISLRARGMIA